MKLSPRQILIFKCTIGDAEDEAREITFEQLTDEYIVAKEMDMKSSIAFSEITLIFSFALILLTAGLNDKAIGKSMMDNVAIKGYDCVAYFKEGKALKGSESFAFQWHNMTWYFSTKENRDLFADAPDKYAPQYDGYCAWAMTEGRLAITDPEVWKIVDGKLYLNCSQAAYEKWSRDIPGNIKKANVIWEEKNKKN